ncbi:MAG: hypothetical protein WC796_02005 [Candidatus Pacearchaeota archaeon]|jgi:protein-disulfide isomerase
MAENNFSETNVSTEVKEEKKESNKWAVATYVLGVVCLILIVVLVSDKIGLTGNVVNSADMEKKINVFINTELLPGGDVVVGNLTKESGLYVAQVTSQGQTVPLYFTLDGKFISPGRPLYDLSSVVDSNDTSTPSVPQNITKSDKPNVELFVMTHCPYGTQAEKGILPAISALAGSAADVKIRFVHYFMHGDQEEQETYTQICIREEQPTKFNAYLMCFLNASDSPGCLVSTGIDKAKLDDCVKSRAKSFYAVDSELSKKYGVEGSPTLVVNGAQAEFYPRSPATALSIICSAFKTAPGVCTSANLSTANPSPGFGFDAQAGSAASAAASC